jgi:STE24 endopeptidase
MCRRPEDRYNPHMQTFTLIFLLALAAGTLLQLWLAGRQAAHVIAHRNQVPPAFADRISLEQHQTAARYTLARLGVERWRLALEALLLLIWTLGGLLAWLDQTWLSLQLPSLWQGTALVISAMLIGTLLHLPLDAWSTFGVESRFGFNRSTPRRFIKDKALEFVVSLLLGVPLLLAILWLMDSAGPYWWAYAWLVWMGFMLLISWAYPTWIAPLFNKFQPLQQGALRERLEALLQRCGFRSDGMFVMDGSSRSAHGNAYFTGFGRNKRIVFFDTLLDGLSEPQIEAVLAHELGHFKRRHVLKMLITGAIFSLLGLALLGWLSQQTWFYQDLGVTRQSDAMALMLFLLMMPVFTVFFSPLMAAFSRKHEFEADDYAAQQTDARALIDGLVSMYRDNASTLTPDPLYSAFHHSHPPAPVRIAHLSSKL